MHPLKSLNVMGDGGIVATNSKKIYEWVKKFRNHGMIDRDTLILGSKYETTTPSSNVALDGLRKLNKSLKNEMKTRK